jgi:hypothetical protein
MAIGDWFRRLFGGKPSIRDEVPKVMGHVVDETGRQVEVFRGPVQHEALSREQLQRIGRLRDVLADAYPMTLDGWVDGFLRDADPETEIRIIEACAVVYQHVVSTAALSVDEKKRLYGVLCAVSAGAAGDQVRTRLPTGKGVPQFDDIIAMYQSARRADDRP